MARLPEPGKDVGTWGIVLNDYLSQSHNADGSIKNNVVTPASLTSNIPQTKIVNLQTELANKESSSNKSTDITTDAASDTKYPSVKSVKAYVDPQISQKQTTITASGILKGSGDGSISTASHGHDGDILTPVDVQDNVTGTATDLPLSQNQGNLLSAQLAEKASQTALAAVASGTPRTTYSTLALLNAGKPTGDQYSYVLADGHRYWWNDTAWVDGGVYQSMGIANDSVVEAMLEAKYKGKYGSINYFYDPYFKLSLATAGIKTSYMKFISTTTGTIVSNGVITLPAIVSAATTWDFILGLGELPFAIGDTISASFDVLSASTLYDLSLRFYNGTVMIGTDNLFVNKRLENIVIPAGTTKLRMYAKNRDSANALQICKPVLTSGSRVCPCNDVLTRIIDSASGIGVVDPINYNDDPFINSLEYYKGFLSSLLPITVSTTDPTYCGTNTIVATAVSTQPFYGVKIDIQRDAIFKIGQEIVLSVMFNSSRDLSTSLEYLQISFRDANLVEIGDVKSYSTNVGKSIEAFSNGLQRASVWGIIPPNTRYIECLHRMSGSAVGDLLKSSGWFVSSGHVIPKNPYTNGVNAKVKALSQSSTGILSKYVSVLTGNDLNEGTKASPLKTIKKAIDLNADVIYVSPGDYREKTLTVTKDGLKVLGINSNVGKINIFGSLNISTWTSTGGGVFSSPFNDTFYGVIQDMSYPLFLTTSLALCQSTIGSSWYDTVNKLLYIHPSDGLSSHSFEAVNTTTVFSGTSNGLLIDNVNFCCASNNIVEVSNISNFRITNCYFTGSMNDTCVYTGNVDLGIFENCEASYSFGNDGFGPKGTGKIKFINCIAHHNFDEGISSHDFTRCSVIGGQCYNNGYARDGVSVGAASSFGGVNLCGGGQGTIYNVESFNNRTYGIAPISFMNPDTNGKSSVHHNHCWGNGDAGIAITANSDLQCYENLVHDNGNGIAFKKEPNYAPKIASKGVIYANKIYDNIGKGISVAIEEIALYNLDIRRNELIKNGIAISMPNEDYIFTIGQNTLRGNTVNYENVKTVDQNLQYVIS